MTATHIYQVSKEYTVTLTVTDNEGATGEEQQIVSVTAPATEPEPDTPTDVTLTGSSVDDGRTWRATVTVTGPEGAYSGSWNTGAVDNSCTIGLDDSSCSVSASQRKNVSSVEFTLDGTNQSLTVAKP